MRMPRVPYGVRTAEAAVDISTGNLSLVVVVGVIALAALAMAYVFRSQVLSASEGTENMRSIAQAVQEGASAFLARQFRTLVVFAGVAFFVLLALPADSVGVRIGRSVFSLWGPAFPPPVGSLGMSRAARPTRRVAAGPNEGGREPAMNVGFR